jgi:Domain of unknown function (DUF4145)
MTKTNPKQYSERLSGVLGGNVERVGVIPRHWDPTLCEKFSVTPREEKTLKWIMKGFASWRMYDVLYPLPVRTFWGRQEGVYTSCTDSTGAEIKPMGYTAPEAFLIFCGDCAEFGRHYFTPCVFDSDLNVLSGFTKCDRCQKEYKVWLMELKGNSNDGNWTEAWITPKPGEAKNEYLQYIPDEFQNLSQYYVEAKAVLDYSLRASAALIRLALEVIITQKFQINKGNLSSEINLLLKSNLLPSDIAEEIDAIRAIGNFASHAFESSVTGELLDVSHEEVIWSFSILESLIEYCFVRPEKAKLRKSLLNEKLKENREKPLKQPPI